MLNDLQEIIVLGGSVTIVARNENKLKDALESLNDIKGSDESIQVRMLSLDVSSDYDTVEKKLDEAVSRMGGAVHVRYIFIFFL